MCKVNMTESARRQECARCGSRTKEHVCPFLDKSRGPMFQQQQHKQPMPVKAPTAAAAAPAASAAAAKATLRRGEVTLRRHVRPVEGD